MLPFAPMPLGKRASAFDDPEWLFELKYDGFRALACLDSGRCTLVSRNGNAFKSFPDVCDEMGRLPVRDAVLDGEIVCLDEAAGRSSTTCSITSARPYSSPSTSCGADTKTCAIFPSPTASTS